MGFSDGAVVSWERKQKFYCFDWISSEVFFDFRSHITYSSCICTSRRRLHRCRQNHQQQFCSLPCTYSLAVLWSRIEQPLVELCDRQVLALLNPIERPIGRPLTQKLAGRVEQMLVGAVQSVGPCIFDERRSVLPHVPTPENAGLILLRILVAVFECDDFEFDIVHIPSVVERKSDLDVVCICTLVQKTGFGMALGPSTHDLLTQADNVLVVVGSHGCTVLLDAENYMWKERYSSVDVSLQVDGKLKKRVWR